MPARSALHASRRATSASRRLQGGGGSVQRQGSAGLTCACAAMHAWSLQVMRRYHITNRDDYKLYNRLCGQVRSTLCTRTLKLGPQGLALSCQD